MHVMNIMHNQRKKATTGTTSAHNNCVDLRSLRTYMHHAAWDDICSMYEGPVV